MFRVLTCLTAEHELRLVALAGLICFLASFAAVCLLHRAVASQARARWIWIATAGAATGCGIWATHFIAMLAYDPGVVVGYGLALTILSLFAAIAITSVGLAVAVSGRSRRAAPIGGAIVGGGVACMHYLGMSALALPGHIDWATDLVLASIIIGMLLGAAAMATACRSDRPRDTAAAAVLLTLAIVAHHFTAMGAVVIVPDPARVIDMLTLSPDMVAVTVAGAAVAVLGMAIVASLGDRRAQGMLQDRNLLLDAALNNMIQGVNMFDAQARLVLFNARYMQMYRLSPDVVKPGCTIRGLVEHRIAQGTFFEADPEQYIAELTSALQTDRKPSRKTLELGDGRVIAVLSQPMAAGGWVVTHEDVTERHRAEKELEKTRNFLHTVIENVPVPIIVKNAGDRRYVLINRPVEEHFGLSRDQMIGRTAHDVFGHTIGDKLLCAVSGRLGAAAEGAFLARLGGDEFALIISGGSHPASAHALAERLMASVAEDVELDGHRLRIGLSIGIAIYPADGTDASSLIGNADAALHRAKSGGRGTIRFFEADMDQRLRERRALVHDLQDAVESRELLVYYQPQARIDGEITGFEALVRWRHPTRGLIGPDMFIPAAEESSLILPIGEWVLRESCREAASWPKPLNIAVNLSPVQFRHGDLPGLVHSVLLETGLPPGRLELEITESVLIDDLARGLTILRRLKLLGVQIAMDDFGTGYSSLSNLQAFAFDKIKIDRSFISSLDTSPQSATIVRAVIGLGRGLDLPVIAEGVETNKQLEFLSAEACTAVQGYLVGKPLPIAAYADAVGRESARDGIASVA